MERRPAAGHRGGDEHLGTVAELSLHRAAAGALAVDEDQDVGSELAALVAEPALELRESRCKLVQRHAERAAGDLDLTLLVREPAQGGGKQEARGQSIAATRTDITSGR